MTLYAIRHKPSGSLCGIDIDHDYDPVFGSELIVTLVVCSGDLPVWVTSDREAAETSMRRDNHDQDYYRPSNTRIESCDLEVVTYIEEV